MDSPGDTPASPPAPRRVHWPAALLVVAGLLLLRVLLWRPLSLAGEAPPDGFTRLSGVIHVHTTCSDGGGTPGQVVADARAAGLSFVVLTDHNTLDAKPFEGYHGDLLVLVGTEVSTGAGHVLGLGIPDPGFRFSGDAADTLEDVRDLGGSAFVAHPQSARQEFRWTGWDLPGPWGVELLNGDSQWREAQWWRLLRTAALYPLNPPYALLGSMTSPDSALKRWDALLGERDAAGIAGADAHGRLVVRKDWAVGLPSYASMFRLARNHVLLEAPLSRDAGRDGLRLVEALARGRSYIGVDALAPADGFFFDARSGADHWTMGDTVAAPVRPLLEAGGLLPPGTRLRLLRDGAPAVEAEGRVSLPAAGPGVYRVEARVPGWPFPWIVSNPIYVMDEARRVARVRRAAWPSPPPPPARVTILDSFEAHTIFEPGVDSFSRLALPILAPGEGVGGSGAARLAFRLGVPSPDHPDVFCAIVNREKRDLSGREGLSFSIRADGVYRIWVQVRDENPASTDEGTEWWFASVKTSPDWRRVAVPFARLRSINPNTDGRLDLDKVRAIVFVLDKGCLKPGTAGTIWLDDVGIY